jgi:hypothetical protein
LGKDLSTERRRSLYAVHAREEIKEIRRRSIIIIIVSLKSLLMGFPSSLPRRALLESDTTFAEACESSREQRAYSSDPSSHPD